MNREKYCEAIKQETLQTYLYKTALRFTKDPTLTEDLLQDCLLKGLEKCYQLRNPKKIKYWLYTIQKRIFFNYSRKTKGRNFLDYAEFDSILADDTKPIDIVDWFSLSDELQLSSSKLEDKYIVPFTMFYLKELSYKEIAHEMEIPIGTVMSRISRSKVILQRYLKQQGIPSFRESFS